MDRDDGIKAELAAAESFQVSLSQPPALLHADKIMKTIVWFTEELQDGQGLLMFQGLREYIDPLHSEAGKEVASTCIISLPFPVKLDLSEDNIKLDGSDTTTIYVLRFQASEQSFVIAKKGSIVRNIKLDDEDQSLPTSDIGGANGSRSLSKSGRNRVTSNVTT